MTSSQRIAINTLATYGRTLFAMALGLFSSRWVLASLGPVDYGLMGVVGALITFVAFLNKVTSVSVARFFAFSIGKGDLDETNKWFNTALSLHTVIPFVLILVGWPIGEWMLAHFLNIPEVRLSTARWVFRFSLVSLFLAMCSTPYMGMYTAKQHITEMSFWGICTTLVNFVFVFWLTSYRGDAWLLYSAGTVTIGVLIVIFQVMRARMLFPECRIRFCYWWDRERTKQVLSFSGWQLFGGAGSLLRAQGTAILLNKYFNPVQYPYVNAAYSVGNNVSGYTQMLSSSLLGAFTPEITASEGRGDRKRMLSQASRVSKFGTYLVLLFAIPLILEIDTVLVLWLKHPPQLAATFCRWVLIMLVIDKMTIGQQVAIYAKGEIAKYSIIFGSSLILTLPISWLFLHLGYSATSIGWAFVMTIALCSIGRVFWVSNVFGASVWLWVKDVLVPCLFVLVFGLMLGAGVIMVWDTPSFWRLCAVTGVTLLSSAGLGLTVVLDDQEKQFLKTNVYKLRRKLF
jgi:O-antigen/teichoic acid export membrane protein